MPFAKGQNPYRPQPGSSIKVEPIRTKTAIANIKKILADKPRDLCLFTLGINTAWRANELLSIRVGQVRGTNAGDTLELKQSKTRKYRMVTINRTVAESVQAFLVQTGERQGDDDYLFFSQRREVLTVPTVTSLVKSWCAAVGLKGNYGSHTLRKTWGYWQYKRGTPLPLLVEAFGHATQQQTLAYLSIQPQEIQDVYEMEL
ncbi:MAG: tyrosine-type recombinase/integrase [Anaerolineae bacterium]|nr:tyrosine-type recombinase/integrase [Anaerolineae bacterium]